MPCFRPLQARYSIQEDGKKDIRFSNRLNDSRLWQEDKFPEVIEWQDRDTGELMESHPINLDCGKCVGCKLSRSKQWAVRCYHESLMYDDNIFITFTYDNEHLPYRGMLVKKDIQDFNKRLRIEFQRGVEYVRDGEVYATDVRDTIRVFYCGEYGDLRLRPHFHGIYFNLDFKDKYVYQKRGQYTYYRSDTLERIWSKGMVIIGEVTLASAAYVARYCMKKVNGKNSDQVYRRIDQDTGEVYYLPKEFSQPSNRPGIGATWWNKYAMSDVYSRDELVVEGYRTKIPRYYDKLLEKRDPDLLEALKIARMENAQKRKAENVHSRLVVKEKIAESALKRLVRMVEKNYR